MAAGDVKVVLTKNRAFSCNVFDGVDDYVEIPHHWKQLGANLADGFTISAWINPRSIGETNGTIIDKSTAGAAGAAGFYYICGTTNTVAFRINAGTIAYSANNSVPYGVWTHVLVTINSTQQLNHYINSVQNGTANQNLTQTISTITTTSLARIGNRSTITLNTFDGSIKSVKMWNRVLTTAEIAQDYAGYTPALGLIHNFKLGGDYADYGSVGAAATNSGSVPAIVDDNVAVATKAQRVASTDKWMIYAGMGGQVGVVNIE